MEEVVAKSAEGKYTLDVEEGSTCCAGSPRVQVKIIHW